MTETPDVLIAYVKRLHACVVTWRPDLPTAVGSPPNGRWLNSTSWCVPALDAWTLLQHFRGRYPDYRVSFDRDTADMIFARLERERTTNDLSLAADGDIPDVLSIKLRTFQRAAIAYGLHSQPRKLYNMPTGTGKTAMACGYARLRKAKTLWITKPSLVSNLTREIAKLTNQHAVELVGLFPSDEQCVQLSTRDDVQHWVISYDALTRQAGAQGRNMWTLALTKLGKFDLMVCDEAHNMKNRDSNRWKVIKNLEAIPAVLFLTATPLVNNGKDLFALLNVLDCNTFASESEFLHTYFSYDGKRLLLAKKLQQDLLPYMFSRTREQVMPDLPPKIRQHHNITLSKAWQSKYDAVLDGLYIDMQGYEHDVPSSVLAQINRFRQVVSQAKVEHTVEHARTLEESGEKVIVFTAWRETAELIARELYAPLIHGGISKDARLEAEQDFQNNPHCRFLVGTFDTLGEGLNLTEGTAVVFNDFEWTPKDHDQAEGRCWGRLNNMHGAQIWYVQVQDSIDEFMMQTLARKQTLIDEGGAKGQRQHVEENASLLKDWLGYMKMHR